MDASARMTSESAMLIPTTNGGPPRRVGEGDWLDLFSGPLALLDRSRCAIHVNASGKRLLERSSILDLQDSRLRAWGNGNQADLEAALSRVLDEEHESALARLDRVDDAERLLVFVRRRDWRGRRQCLIGLADGSVELGRSAQQIMREAWGLSDAEARVARAVGQGTDLKTYAVQAGVSHHTARSQLNAALAKSGAARQADLVRLLLTGPAYLCNSRNPTATRA